MDSQNVDVMIAPERFVTMSGSTRDIFTLLSALKENERTKDCQVRFPDPEVGLTCWQPIS